MASVETSIVINRPVEEVFALLSNRENNPKWAPDVLEVAKPSEGPIGVGTTWREVRKVLGQRLEGEFEYVEYEPNRKIRAKSKSGRSRLMPRLPLRVSKAAHESNRESKGSQAASSS